MNSLKRFLLVAAALLTGAVAIPALTGSGAGPAAGKPAAKAGLRSFGSCSGLVRYARRHAPKLAGDRRRAGAELPRPAPVPQGLIEGDALRSPPPDSGAGPNTGGGEDTSRTNVQEAGVDEPDIVKAAGGRILAISGSRLHSVEAGETPRRLGSVALPGAGHELLVSGDRALVISSDAAAPTPVGEGPRPVPRGESAVAPIPAAAKTLLTELDLSNHAAMRVVRTQEVEGTYKSARLTGHTARVVVTAPSRAVYEDVPGLRGRVEGWMPRTAMRRGRSRRAGAPRPLTSCRNVRYPLTFSGLEMLSVLTVDVEKGLPAVDVDSLFTGAEIVYGSPASLYVATERFAEGGDVPAAAGATAIHRFDISDPARTDYRASGSISGFLLNQFSLSEHEGRLRAASTERPTLEATGREPQGESHVTVLEQQGRRLVRVGRVGGLGKGERIYAVRFIGNTGYVVTFRETDPLYTVDLSVPARPRVAGELKIRGYSAYLHPVGENLLLGVGQDATDSGRTLGTQLSLFDVSDMAHPVRLHQRTIGPSSSSEAEYDHHAFLYWQPAALAVLPVSPGPVTAPAQPGRTSQDGPFTGAVGFRVSRESGIDEAGRVIHDSGGSQVPVSRALVVGDRLFTLSEGVIEMSDLETLAERARVPLP